MTLAQAYGMNPFEILEARADDVINLINHALLKAQNKPQKSEKPAKQAKIQDDFWNF